jgi:hypothetical protein
MYRQIRVWVLKPSDVYFNPKAKRDVTKMIMYAAIGSEERTRYGYERILRQKPMSYDVMLRLGKAGWPKRFKSEVYGIYKTPAEARLALDTIRQQYRGVICEELT